MRREWAAKGRPSQQPDVSAVLRHMSDLSRALRRAGGTHGFTDLLNAVVAGRAQVFSSDDSVLVTEILETSAGRSCVIWVAAGTLEGTLALSEVAAKAARDADCDRMVFTGRRGWDRIPEVRENGWRPYGTMWTRKLEGS